MADTVIIHSSEVCLKGGNRRLFEDRLIGNIRDRLKGCGDFDLKRTQGSVIVSRDGSMDETLMIGLKRRLRTVFGISHFLFASRCRTSLEEIEKTAAAELDRAGGGSFKIETRRSDKAFPVKSPEVNRRAGAFVLQNVNGSRVDVREPRTTVEIEIHREATFVGTERCAAWGGLPTGSAGKVVVLLSGGIDSPVAAWKTMRRGCQATFVHFHSYPYVDRQSVDKVERIARVLGDYQSGTALYLVPLADAQRLITARAEPSLRIILYRRLMVRIAELAASAERAQGLVTGDSIGQVASQTLENLAVVSAAAKLPIYRPLIGENKEDIIAWSKKIGTYEISIEPHDDCCSLFQPPRPATKASLAAVEKQESGYSPDELAAAAWNNTERIAITGRTWDIETAGNA